MYIDWRPLLFDGFDFLTEMSHFFFRVNVFLLLFIAASHHSTSNNNLTAFCKLRDIIVAQSGFIYYFVSIQIVFFMKCDYFNHRKFLKNGKKNDLESVQFEVRTDFCFLFVAMGSFSSLPSFYIFSSLVLLLHVLLVLVSSFIT